MSLEDLRKRIDELDKELVQLLNERTRVAVEIGKIKQDNGEEVYAPGREKRVLEQALGQSEGPVPEESLRAIYREIMSAALALERDVTVSYLGPPATFTHLAARARFGASVKYEAVETISDVFSAVQNKKADYGVVPIENSTEGAVTHTLDQFAGTPLKICAEILLPISHHLMAKGSREQIKTIYSKWEVFGQCRRWLQEKMPGVDVASVSSTARAAEMAAEDPASGALASSLAAELYGLDILEHDVQDLGGNTTRFLVIGKNYGKPTKDDKTSIFFGVKDKVGALYEALGGLKRYGINMTKIESRPSKTKAWEYYFFVDFEGHADEENVKKALKDLEEHCAVMTVLGSYPKAIESE